MNLQNHIQRCQGRSMRTPLGETLAEECTDCARRICIEPDQSYSWMEPPPINRFFGRICGSWLPDHEELVDVVVGMRTLYEDPSATSEPLKTDAPDDDSGKWGTSIASGHEHKLEQREKNARLRALMG